MPTRLTRLDSYNGRRFFASKGQGAFLFSRRRRHQAPSAQDAVQAFHSSWGDKLRFLEKLVEGVRKEFERKLGL